MWCETDSTRLKSLNRRRVECFPINVELRIWFWVLKCGEIDLNWTLVDHWMWPFVPDSRILLFFGEVAI